MTFLKITYYQQQWAHPVPAVYNAVKLHFRHCDGLVKSIDSNLPPLQADDSYSTILDFGTCLYNLKFWHLPVPCTIQNVKILEERNKNQVKTVENNVDQIKDDEDVATSEPAPVTISERPTNPRHYQLASAGLWWDSFEEDPLFDLSQQLDEDLTLNEGEKIMICPYLSDLVLF